MDLVTAEKKDSQGLCFIGKVRLPDFLQQQLKPKEGIIYEVPSDSILYQNKITSFDSKEEELKYLSHKIQYQPENGKKVGMHPGAHFFTVGQRKGLNVGGTKFPLFILSTHVIDNAIYTGQGSDHPGLLRRALKVNHHEVHWIREDLKLEIGQTMEVMARIRYRQALQKAVLYPMESGLYVLFDQFQSAITEGQFVAWYLNDELMGSGVIS
jgi:tRNA-specific 2-thiouridylase